MGLLNPEQISRFYANWGELQVHRDWAGLWNKQFKICTCNDTFISLNKKRNRLGFNSLKPMCIRLQPTHVYMSVLNWLMPERVAEKSTSGGAYPIGGEYVVDIDSYLNYQKYTHRTTEDGVFEGCLNNSKELTQHFLDKIEENYRDVRVVFSGKSGFHIHVLDFDLRDWTDYREENPLKSHEVARVAYTRHLQDSVGGFDKYHFILSGDVMRVITVPESLNGETGLVCSYLGSPVDFADLKVSEVLVEARGAKWLTNGVDFVPMNELHAHPEPLLKGR